VAAVVFGVLTLLCPQLAVLALAWAFGVYALVVDERGGAAVPV
jgi:uncharacterized membrane protein HdeD (DUF308 family)